MRTDVGNYLDSLYPNPKCELIYHKDYELLISIVLSAQSTDRRVNVVTPILFSKYDTLEKLMNAPLSDLETILRSIGSFRKKAYYVKEIARLLVLKFDGKVPINRDLLMDFPGVGRKTINVFLSEFYQIPAFAVDTHVERVSKRLGLCSKRDNVDIIEKKLMKKFPKEEWGKRHLQMVLFGRYHCKSIKPNCSNCLFVSICREKKKNLI
ncbi:MAG: endonuclease III [Bacilli bacterium]|nr:endonuclease III [Bacilli bacterium]